MTEAGLPATKTIVAPAMTDSNLVEQRINLFRSAFANLLVKHIHELDETTLERLLAEICYDEQG